MNLNLNQTLNPFLPSWEYIPDGEPYVFNDRVYIYGSHDRFNGEIYCMNDYVCWSANVNDLGNWRFEGITLKKTDDPANKDESGSLYAPDVALGYDGRYYMYYALSNQNLISVAVCDTPAGKYEFLGYVKHADGTPLGQREGDEPQFDPGVLCEDGQVYLYTGFCQPYDTSRHGSMVTILESDMLTVKQTPKIIAPSAPYSEGTGYENHAFFEASSIRKINDTYYFIYSSFVNHELCYATSKSPMGPFKYGGVIISNADLGISTYKEAEKPGFACANNHGSIVEINGDWFIFYHRHTNGHNYSRQACFEKIEIAQDGSIKQVEMSSCCGLAPLKATGKYPTYIACNLYTDEYDKDNARIPWTGWLSDRFPKIVQQSFDIEVSDYEKHLNSTEDNAAITGYVSNVIDSTVIGFKYFDIKSLKQITIYTRGYGYGTFDIYAATKQLPNKWIKIGTTKINASDNISKAIADVSVSDGCYALYFKFSGSNNLSFFEFEFIC